VRPRRLGPALLCGPSTSPLDACLVMLEVVETLFGLLNLLTTWRFFVPATIGTIAALFAFFRLQNPFLGLGAAVALLVAFFWLGYRWQRTAEVRWRQSSNNRWRGP